MYKALFVTILTIQSAFSATQPDFYCVGEGSRGSITVYLDRVIEENYRGVHYQARAILKPLVEGVIIEDGVLTVKGFNTRRGFDRTYSGDFGAVGALYLKEYFDQYAPLGPEVDFSGSLTEGYFSHLKLSCQSL